MENGKIMNSITSYQAKYYAYSFTQEGRQGVEGLTQSLLSAAVDLNPHQVEAALFALRSPISQGVLLADEVGLGKTIEAGLVLCQLWAGRKRKLLIICPASLRKQWQCELEEKFNLPTKIIDKKSSQEDAKKGKSNPYDGRYISISSYQYAARMQGHLKTIDWDCVVIDEAHKLRNSYQESNRVGQSLRWALEGRRKLLLSATPLQNSLTELYGIVTLLDPTLFGDLKTFRSRYVNSGGDTDELRARLKDFCHRTLRKDVQAYIKYTQRIPITQTFESSDQENKLYEDVSAYLQDDQTYAFPSQQRTMLTLVVRKVMASSTTALLGTLESILSRLQSLKEGKDKEGRILMENIVKVEPNILDEIAGDETECDTESIQDADDEMEPQIDPAKLEQEITLVKGLIHRAQSIGTDEKTKQLLVALKAGWKKLHELGAEQKAVIFTESRRSMDFLKNFLAENGYAGQVVCYSGGGKKDAVSTEIYRKYKAAHPNESSSKDVMMRHALIDAFEHKAKILIATEAGAEGINLQFCSMVVNYDLPWNPQRVEQRIGRCHRYGQKHDVVVVNFCNKRNAADVRVFELLRDKFNLFEGVFGASNDILGFVDDAGQTFEQRINDILRLCRTTEEIEDAFDRLQNELQDQITAQKQATCKAVIENLDEEVREHLRIDPEYASSYLSQEERRFIRLTEYILGNRARFYPEQKAFDLLESPSKNIPTGRYSYDRTDTSIRDIPYRLNSPLAEWVLNEAKKAETPYSEVVFNVSAYHGKISALDEYRGKSGYLILQHLCLKSLDAQDFLLFSATLDDGTSLDAEVAEKFFEVFASAREASGIPEYIEAILAKNADLSAQATVNRVGESNNEHFKEASEKLERWRDDQVEAATRNVDDLKTRKREIERAIRQTKTLEENLALQKQLDEVNHAVRKARQNVDNVEDEADRKKNRLLDDLQRKLIPETERTTLFKVRWKII